MSKAARVGQQYIVSMPINDAGKPLGVLHVGIDAAFVDHVLLEVLLDVVVVLVVSLFFTLELLNFMAGRAPPPPPPGTPRPRPPPPPRPSPPPPAPPPAPP